MTYIHLGQACTEFSLLFMFSSCRDAYTSAQHGEKKHFLCVSAQTGSYAVGKLLYGHIKENDFAQSAHRTHPSKNGAAGWSVALRRGRLPY